MSTINDEMFRLQITYKGFMCYGFPGITTAQNYEEDQSTTQYNLNIYSVRKANLEDS